MPRPPGDEQQSTSYSVRTYPIPCFLTQCSINGDKTKFQIARSRDRPDNLRRPMGAEKVPNK